MLLKREKKMPTVKQKIAVKKLVEVSINPKKKKTKGQILKEAGYSDNTAIKPTQVFNSTGVKKLLAESGLTEDFITKALVDDIEAKPKKRYHELNLGAEILGMKKQSEKPDNPNPELHLHFHDEKILKENADS